jgi:nitrate reductase assembly molybdenum cofactor insertion protein NarJ
MNTPAMVLGAEEKRLLNEAAEWHLLGLLFSCPGPEWRRRVAEVSSEIGDAALRATGERALAEATEGLYHSVFGPGGPAPPREASYNRSIQLGQILSEVAAYYDAFAYHPASDEVLDHVAVEAGFIAYLRLKQAYALCNADAEHAATAAEAAQSFLTEHLSAIAAPLAAGLEQLRVQYLAEASAELVRRVGPAPHRQPPDSVPELAEDCDFNCGPAEL